MQAGWLDRHPRLAILFLVLFPFVSQLPGFLSRGRINPIWQYSWLFTDVKPGLLPGQPYLDPNIGSTTQALGHLAAWDWLHGIIPWWNPYVGVGVPLAGEMQPGAFFLPFSLLLALPNGVLCLTIAMQIVTGLTTYALLRALSLTRWTALIAASLYALNGTIAWMPGPVSVICSLPFLPLLLWGIEQAFAVDAEPGRHPNRAAASVLAMACAIAWSVLAGFPEPAYFDGLLALAWAACRLVQSPSRFRFAARVAGGGMLGLMLAAPLLIAFCDALFHSDVFDNHAFGKWSLGLVSLVTWLLPSGLGPTNSGPKAMEDVWGNLGGYSTVLIVFLAILSMGASGGRARAKGLFPLRVLLIGWLILSLCKTYGPQPVIDLVNYVPGFDRMAFYRYAAPSWEFALILLAAFGLERLAGDRLGRKLVMSASAVVIALSIALYLTWTAGAETRQPLWLGLSVAWAVLNLALALFLCLKFNPKIRQIAVGALALCDATVMFALPQLTAGQGGTLDFGPVQYLQAHAGLSRMVSIGPLQPNYTAYFQIAGINHQLLPGPAKWNDFVNRRLFPGFLSIDNGMTFFPTQDPPFDPQGALNDVFQHAADYLDLGVRYVITVHGQNLKPGVESAELAEAHQVVDLAAGQSLKARVEALPGSKAEIVTQAAVLIGTVAGSPDSAIEIRLCAGNLCRSGHRALTDAVEGEFLFVDLDEPLVVPAGTALQIDITPLGGSARAGLWVWPKSEGLAQVVAPADGISGALRLGFTYAPNDLKANKVFSGEVADIWELAGAAPYFEAVPSQACTLSRQSWDAVDADCSAAAMLIRRELLTPGWRVAINSASAELLPQGDLFQAVNIPAGKSTISFAFAPPYIIYGWLAFAMATLILGGLGIKLTVASYRLR